MTFLKETAEFIPLKIYLVKGTSLGISLERTESPNTHYEKTLIKIYQVNQTTDISYMQIGRVTIAHELLYMGKNRLRLLEAVELFITSHPRYIPLTHH